MGGPPGYAPQPQQAPNQRAWPVIAAAIFAFLLVAGAIVAAVLTSASGGNSVHGATVLTVTAPRPAGLATPGSSRSESQPSGPDASSDTGSATGGANASPSPASGHGTPLTLVPYGDATIVAEIPAGWNPIEDEAHKPGYVESKWSNPADSNDTILIDTSPATNDTLEQDAAPVHNALLSASGYQELSYGPGDLAGFESWMWVFRISGDQRVDYFFNRCTSGFAVLGSTVPGRFERLAATFRSVAESVHPGERSSPC